MGTITIQQIWAEKPYLGLHDANSKTVWDYQISLMKVYQDAGRLIDHKNFDINNRENQKFIRELVGFLEEELIEAQDSYEKLVAHFSAPTLPFERGPSSADFNEEVADCLHFWVELFIFLGLSHEDLVNYYTELSKEKSMNTVNDDFIKMSLQYATSYVNQTYPTRRPSFNTPLPDEWLPYEMNCTLVGDDNKELMNRHLFYTLKHLKMVQNFLKNKYWKAREDYQVDQNGLRIHLMEAWVHWTISLVFTNYHDHFAMIYTYLLKNTKNKLKAQTH